MRLLESSPEESGELMNEMAAVSRALKNEVANICWFMRGSVSWEQAWNLTTDERVVISKLIKDNIERSEKSGMALL